jgi:hypothetical protein
MQDFREASNIFSWLLRTMLIGISACAVTAAFASERLTLSGSSTVSPPALEISLPLTSVIVGAAVLAAGAVSFYLKKWIQGGS